MLVSLVATMSSCGVSGGENDIVRPRLSFAGIAAADYFPLEPGWKWTYAVSENGVNTHLVRTVLERQGDIAVVEEGGERITYAVTPEGIAEKDGDRLGDYIIKNPIRPGVEWAVEGGRARILTVDGKYSHPVVGRYEGCVGIAVTRNDPTRITWTTFAPYLGPVVVGIQASDGKEFFNLALAALVGVTRPGKAATVP